MHLHVIRSRAIVIVQKMSVVLLSGSMSVLANHFSSGVSILESCRLLLYMCTLNNSEM